MKILVISSYTKSLINFRGDLLKSFRQKGHDVLTIGSDDCLSTINKLMEWGINFHRINIERNGTNIFKDIITYTKLKSIIRTYSPDIILSYTIKPNIFGSIAAKSNRYKKIYTLVTGLGSAFDNYTSIKFKLLSLITETLYRIALKNVDGVIFQNPDDREIFLKKKIVTRENSFIVNGSGVNLDYYLPSNSIINPITFLFIGRLIKDKGIVEFIQAAIAISKKYQVIKFDIVGWVDDNPSGITKKELNKWEKLDFLKFHGKIEDVRPYIERCSVFVLPSYREGTPRTVLESMAMGKPIITSDAPGCRETVKDGINGFLIPVKDSKSLADKMEIFIQNPDLISSMGYESRKLVEEVYDVHKVNRQIHKILCME